MRVGRSSYWIQILTAAVCVFAGVGWSAGTATGACPNEAFRTGRSASLPDCRAYELVTPKELGRTGAINFQANNASFLASRDGERLALRANQAFLEPAVSAAGTDAVFSRTAAGWVMTPIATPVLVPTEMTLEWFSPDLSQVGFRSIRSISPISFSHAEGTLEFGPIGGPYTTVASFSPSQTGAGAELDHILRHSQLAGGNPGTPSVPVFSVALIESPDHWLLSPGPEREAAEQARPEANVLYEWANGRLRLVNIDNEGRLLSPCGAVLGDKEPGEGSAINAVSADGSRVFFTTLSKRVPGCLEPALYMRVDGKETVDVSEPEGVSVPPASRSQVFYVGASTDGSKVFFTTATALTADAGRGLHLYEYSTEAPAGHRLTLIASEVNEIEQFISPLVLVSEEGSIVYYRGNGVVEAEDHSVSVSGIWRYDTVTGKRNFVASPRATTTSEEPYYATPNGEFLAFQSGGGDEQLGPEVVGTNGRLEEEARGAGHQEVYRYDAADGSVICVSCGESVAPAEGEVRQPEPGTGVFSLADGARTSLWMSDDGRRVFFQSSAKLVPQDTNEDSPAEENFEGALGAGADVYEWEAVGTEEAPGVSCRVAVGCTHLISAGETVGPERFLGASEDGRDVFFTSAAQLVPQATPEFTNIYDARVDGGFPPQPPTVECTSCQGVGSAPPPFNLPASDTFMGAGNPAEVATTPFAAPVKPKPKPKCRRGGKRKKGRCARVTSHKGSRRS
jgi:hypothetical protein